MRAKQKTKKLMIIIQNKSYILLYKLISLKNIKLDPFPHLLTNHLKSKETSQFYLNIISVFAKFFKVTNLHILFSSVERHMQRWHNISVHYFKMLKNEIILVNIFFAYYYIINLLEINMTQL